MSERCRCGADVIAELAFCVMCGVALRPQPVVAGARRHGSPPAPYHPAPATRPPFTGHGPVAHPSFPAHPVPGPWAVAAPPAPPRSSAPWIAGAAAIVVLAVAAAVAVLTLGPALSSPSAAPSTTVVAPSTTTVAAAPAASGTSTTGSGSDELDARVAADRTDVEALDGQWVPQLSSKAIGTVDGGVTYDAAGILEHYRGLVASYPDAKLLDSSDWSVFRNAGYRVVVVARPFTTAAGANAWCDAQGIDADQCFAKKLSHTSGPTGTTVQR